MLPLLLLAACAGPVPPDLPTHTLAFSGDVILGRRLNVALQDDERKKNIFGDVAPLLQSADVSLANAEGVISQGGVFSDKGEPAPILYRAVPDAVPVLALAGIDVVAVGNNHVGDYGSAAFGEMLDRLSLAGIGWTGGGRTAEEARRPAFVEVGDVTLAFVGADLTPTRAYAATKDHPGTLWLPGQDPDKAGNVLRTLRGIARKARVHADLVVLSPHWGENWKKAPTAARRELARDLVHAGYDAILGHSAHLVQGVEVIDGRPVIYDAGNLLLDGVLPGETSDGVLYRLTFNRAGFTGIEAVPLALGESEVNVARDARATAILARLATRSTDLGTSWTLTEGRAVLPLQPGRLRGLTSPPTARAAPAAVREATPLPLVQDTLPDDATPLDATFEGGIRLLGRRFLLDALPGRHTGQVISTFWTTPATPAVRPLWIHLEARGAGGKRDIDLHLPGDWRLPVERWPVDRVVEDTVFMRLSLPADLPAVFSVGLEGPDGLLPPGLVDLGEVPYRAGAPTVFQVLARRPLTPG